MGGRFARKVMAARRGVVQSGSVWAVAWEERRRRESASRTQREKEHIDMRGSVHTSAVFASRLAGRLGLGAQLGEAGA